jgi:hypothetical protein
MPPLWPGGWCWTRQDLGVLLDLPPATVDGLKDTAVFLPE